MTRKRRCLGLATLCASSALLGSFESVFDVAQPLLTNGEGLRVTDVPFIRHGTSWDRPWLHVCWTAEEVLVSTDSGYQNRNAANRIGIQIRPIPGPKVEPFDKNRRPGLFGDTLRVEVDLSKLLDEAPLPIGGPPGPVLKATRECMIVNAKRAGRGVRFLDIQVVGDDRHSWMAGTVDLSE